MAKLHTKEGFAPLTAVVLAGVVGLVSSLLGHAQTVSQEIPIALDSGPGKVALVELYTSEGCSSCPPADRWLSRLEEDPRLWREWVPVAFHVDYWNYLGWADRFASPRHSNRQRHYAALDVLSSVYTPGFVVDGQEWRGFFRRADLPGRVRSEVGSLKVWGDRQHLEIAFAPSAPEGVGDLAVTVALLGFDLATEVTAGENRRRTLHHDFVVLDTLAAALLPGARGDLRGRVALPEPWPASERYALAAWVSRWDDPRPVQAVGGWVAEP
ncbi:MAG: DUF1223 domain-containing protein [Candidatus Competibacterales bacterium]